MCCYRLYKTRDINCFQYCVLAGANNIEQLDVYNGILLSPVYDALFDQHLISFENNGKIILSSSLRTSAYDKIGVTGRETIKNLSVKNHTYLERHREALL